MASSDNRLWFDASFARPPFWFNISPNMGRYIETYRGIVQLSHCDTMGHMNTQYYVHIFDQTVLQLVAQMGFSTAQEDYRGFGWADVKHVIEYRQELRAGTAIVGESAIVGLGRTSLTTRHVIRKIDSKEPAATLEAVTVYFDLTERVAAPIPTALRKAGEDMTAA